MTTGLTVADLARNPLEVARALPVWQRGDTDEAVAATLTLAARQLHARAPVVWAWAGHTPDDCPVWILPVHASAARAFAPRAPARVLIGMLRAAVEAGALVGAISLFDWHGLVLLPLPGLDDEIAPLALADALPDAGAVVLAPLPTSLTLPAEGIHLVGPPDSMDHNDPLTVLAQATWSHPIRVALTLADHGQPMDAPAYPAGIVAELRRWGLAGTPPPPGACSLAVEDDPCPRRRHARIALRRLLRTGKVGDQHHTDFVHLCRGAAADDRGDAFAVGEALVRAGLLGEKQSVGQRHVYLRREALPDIHALIDRGDTADPMLVDEWTAPAPGMAPPA